MRCRGFNSTAGFSLDVVLVGGLPCVDQGVNGSYFNDEVKFLRSSEDSCNVEEEFLYEFMVI